MTVAYFDSSALVKLYADEEHCEAVRSVSELPVAISFARVEVVAAFFGKVRSGELTRMVARVLSDAFLADWDDGRMLGIAVTAPIEAEAVELAGKHLLRGFDALHLASANAVRRVIPECTQFVCFDERLSMAAQGEGFTLRTG